jgi:hypothetical protein
MLQARIKATNDETSETLTVEIYIGGRKIAELISAHCYGDDDVTVDALAYGLDGKPFAEENFLAPKEPLPVT